MEVCNKEKRMGDMKWALYSRVSTREQTTDNQKIILENWAKNNNYEYDYFEETESTRKTRPIKFKLLNRLRAKEYFGVVVVKLDRWARSSQELSTEIKELYEKGIKFVSIRENIDLSTSTGTLQFNILSAFAEFERDLIRERTLDGLSRAKKDGKCLGRPKGKKDSGKRRKSGYYLRWAGKKH